MRDQSRGDRDATVAQVEGEWSFGYTRIAGEYLWTEARDGDGRCARARRLDRDHADDPAAVVRRRPATTISGRCGRALPDNADASRRIAAWKPRVGFRVTPEVTLRASYLTRKGYVVGFWDDQFLGVDRLRQEVT